MTGSSLSLCPLPLSTHTHKHTHMHAAHTCTHYREVCLLYAALQKSIQTVQMTLSLSSSRHSVLLADRQGMIQMYDMFPNKATPF